MKTNNLTKIVKSNAGYTIDQTILIVAVIAILITLIIASVGMSLLSRTAGTKLASHMEQVEKANTTFYATHGVWPNSAVASASSTINTASALATADAVVAAYKDKHQNLLPGFRLDGVNLYHKIGSGGRVLQQEVDLGSVALSDSFTKGRYYVIEFESVPMSEAKEANSTIDGDDPTEASGRLVVHSAAAGAFGCGAASTPPAANSTANTVDVCYIANMIN